MDLSFVLHETHTRAISALGFNAGRRELMIGYEGTVTACMHTILSTNMIKLCALL